VTAVRQMADHPCLDESIRSWHASPAAGNEVLRIGVPAISNGGRGK
jgi:hypothetical protein